MRGGDFTVAAAIDMSHWDVQVYACKIKNNMEFAMTMQPLPLEIDAHGLNNIQSGNLTTAYIDVRMPWEVAQAPAGESVNVPLNQLPQHLGELPKNVDHLVIICAHGHRSLMATQWLRQNGFVTAQSLAGGMASWRRFEEMAA